VDFEETLAALQGFLGEQANVMITGRELDWTLIAYLRGPLKRASDHTFEDIASTEETLGFDVGTEGHFFIHKKRFVSASQETSGITIETSDAMFRVFREDGAAV
jgi:hypothetical protein